ncbi:MAG: Spy/CpxP family protein refolding chaperone [Pyrinomonadaceae bacterium]
MKKAIVTFLAVALVALGTIFAVAQTKDGDGPGKRMHRGDGEFGGMRGKRGMRGGHGEGMMFRGIDLTDEQKAQLKSIHEASREKMKPVMEQLRQNRKQLQDLTAGGTFDEAQVQALATQQGNLTAQMIVEKERTKAAAFAILTAEQKAQLAERKQQFEQKRAERKAKWAERKEGATKPAADQ